MSTEAAPPADTTEKAAALSQTSEGSTTDVRKDSHLDNEHVDLGWRSWLVVFVTCFAIMAQVHVVVAAGSVIAFIIRDLGQPSLAGWIIQGPLLVQAVLSPIIGRLSDVLDRKYLATIPPLIAFVGAVLSATAKSLPVVIGGGLLIGVTLSTIAIVQAIPAEVLPLKYRAVANGLAFIAGAVGGLIGVLGSGAVTNAHPGGWRDIFWIQAAFHGASSVGLFLFYWPPRRSVNPTMDLRSIIWACDPIGSITFVLSASLMLLALDWTGGTFAWSDPHVVAPLTLGLVLLVVFCLYEWKGRSDGLLAHVFFHGSPNFALSIFAFAIEGWISYSAVNSITPQIILNLGFETSAWRISIRLLSFNLTILFASIPVTWYATKYKDLKSPLLVTFTLFLITSICYATLKPGQNHAQIVYNVIAGIGQSGPLTLLVALVQFTAPHAYLSTATGLAFSARAIGGAFGSAVLDAIINNRLSATYAGQVGAAAVAAGLPAAQVPGLIAGLLQGIPPNVTAPVLAAATAASEHAYAHAYNLAWVSIIPFIALAIVAVACLRGVADLMTERVEATVEPTAEALVTDEKKV